MALGCTLLLRGVSDYYELTRVKAVIKFLVYVAYSQRLEMALLQNQFAMPLPSASGAGSTKTPQGSRASLTTTLSPIVGSYEARGIGSGLGAAAVRAEGGGLATAEAGDGGDPPSPASQVSTLAVPAAEVTTLAVPAAEVTPWYGKVFPTTDEGWERRAKGFQAVLDAVALSTSPGVALPMPFLFSPACKRSTVLGYLRADVNWSPLLTAEPAAATPRPSVAPETPPVPDRKDALEPLAHQQLNLLFSVWCEGGVVPCIAPEAITLSFYDDSTDMTLGKYLERFCLNEQYRCPRAGCESSIEHHYRQFVHGTSRVQVAFDRLRESIPQADPTREQISMWSWCRECNQLTPVIPMSEQTYHMSFSKYLELTFFADA